MSMLKKASRKQVKIKLQVGGPSGAGKTVGALKIAYGLCGDWNKICIIDTENESASLYADSEALGIGEFNTIALSKFDATSYVNAINECVKEGMEVIIIDSITHLWEHSQDIVARLGGQFKDWKTGKDEFNRVRKALLQAPVHVISSVRKKEEYSVQQDDKGKTKIVKQGLATVQEGSMNYEYTIVFDVESNHFTTCSKDRTALFVDAAPFQITEETGKKIKDWCTTGKIDERINNLPILLPQIDEFTDLKELVAFSKLHTDMHTYPDFTGAVKSKFDELKKIEEENKKK